MVGNDGHYIKTKDAIWLDDLFTIDNLKTQTSVYETYHGAYLFSGHKNTYCAFWNHPNIQKHQIMFNHTLINLLTSLKTTN